MELANAHEAPAPIIAKYKKLKRNSVLAEVEICCNGMFDIFNAVGGIEELLTKRTILIS
jgi:hypothetical protein